MYYEEMMIDGILCWRSGPNDPWTQFTIAELSARAQQLATLTAERDEYKSLNEHHKEQFLKANLELAKVREELRERKDNFYQDAIEYRGVRFEDRCDYCGGTGVMSYGSTATWHGGIGGQAITNDACCYCWGSGDKHRPWTDLRKHQQQLTEAKQREARLKLAIVEWIHAGFLSIGKVADTTHLPLQDIYDINKEALKEQP